MSILNINDLALQLVALDFSDGHTPSNDENDQSRIYLGVHWQFDAIGGNQVGTAIADQVFDKFK
jgi:transcriptional regulator of acetoin/glycerol metabolism